MCTYPSASITHHLTEDFYISWPTTPGLHQSFQMPEIYFIQCTHGTGKTGKTGKMAKRIPVRENTRNLEILSKHREFCQNTGIKQGILLAQVVNVLILKVKDIVIVAEKKILFFPEAG